jgi:predicted nucleotidyltransferase
MNIHFKDEALFNQLMDSSLVWTTVGSHLYDLNDAGSDLDYLCIYVPSISEETSFSFTNHQLQYKKDNVDYNFVNLYNFIRNTINGDSTINFEVVNSPLLVGTPLEFLYQMREAFNNYMVIRSYLGLARRDLKQVSKAETGREKNKKIQHAIRGYLFAKRIYNNDFHLRFSEEELRMLNEVMTFDDYIRRNAAIDTYSVLIDDFRRTINKELDEGKFTRFMKPDNQLLLDRNIYELITSDVYNNKQFNYMDMRMIYDANENGIKYE